MWRERKEEGEGGGGREGIGKEGEGRPQVFHALTSQVLFVDRCGGNVRCMCGP